ncbi:hypothetical protein MUK42_04041 [Musa troglodytarum]|uniref:Uncharacterized protein n=2 Tax=Musa troglodytarum TaxID=320322 RepID=A0A9E7HA99_9LILI|nr:hypothetical protein MUK42_04041 [Musa troglodytarum]URE29517.1 hypothetical protein MUK42_04041 [Musa troglodytarum]
MPATATVIGAVLGLGTQMYSNALRKLPYMRHPWEHVLGMGLGAIFVNQLVKYDEKLKEDLDKMLDKAKAANERRYFDRGRFTIEVLQGQQMMRMISTFEYYNMSSASSACLESFMRSSSEAILREMWSSRSATFRELGRSAGAVLVHCKATSSTSNMDDSSCRSSGFRTGSSDASRSAAAADVIRDRTHLTISMSPSKVRSVGINPLTSSISTIPMLYTSPFSVAFGKYSTPLARPIAILSLASQLSSRFLFWLFSGLCSQSHRLPFSMYSYISRCSPWLLLRHPNRIFFTVTVSPVGNSAL